MNAATAPLRRIAHRVTGTALAAAALLLVAGCAGGDSITTIPGAEQSTPSRECKNGRDEYSRRLNPASLAELKQLATLVVVGTVTSQNVRSGVIRADGTPPQTISPPSIPEGSLPPGVGWTPPEKTRVDSPTEATLSFLDSQVELHEVLRGQVGEASVVLRSPGDGSTTDCEPEDLAPVIGEKYLLFLLPSPAAPFEESEPANTYWIAGGAPAGRFFVFADGTLGRDKGTSSSPHSDASVEVAAMTLDQIRNALK